MKAPSTWGWGAPDKEKNRLAGYFRVLQQLREAGLNRCGIVSAYHKRRVTPLMDLSGTVMSSEGIDVVEVCSD